MALKLTGLGRIFKKLTANRGTSSGLAWPGPDASDLPGPLQDRIAFAKDLEALKGDMDRVASRRDYRPKRRAF